MTELAGYNRWMEYPEEIEIGSLIRFGEGYVRIFSKGYIENVCFFEFESGTEHEPRFTGTLTLNRANQIETFTKQPS